MLKPGDAEIIHDLLNGFILMGALGGAIVGLVIIVVGASYVWRLLNKSMAK